MFLSLVKVSVSEDNDNLIPALVAIRDSPSRIHSEHSFSCHSSFQKSYHTARVLSPVGRLPMHPSRNVDSSIA